MKASELIKALEKAVVEVGDLEMCLVTPTGVINGMTVCTNNDYYDEGRGMLYNTECAHGKIAIDYDYY